MLVLMKEVIEVIYGRKVHENGEIYHFWANFGDLYRYTFELVPVQPSKTEPIPVQVRAVPVHPALF